EAGRAEGGDANRIKTSAITVGDFIAGPPLTSLGRGPIGSPPSISFGLARGSRGRRGRLPPRNEIADPAAGAGVGPLGNRPVDPVAPADGGRPQRIELIVAAAPRKKITAGVVAAPDPEVAILEVGALFEHRALPRAVVGRQHRAGLVVLIDPHVHEIAFGKKTREKVAERIVALAQRSLAALADELKPHAGHDLIHRI